MLRVALWVSFPDLFLCFLNNGHCMKKPKALKCVVNEHQASRGLAPAARATVPLWRPLPTFSAIFFLHLVSIFLLSYDQPAISAQLEAMVPLLAPPGPRLGG